MKHKNCHSKRWHNIFNKYGREVRFVAKDLSEMDALWLENMCIKGWGRIDLEEGPLINGTDGGEGVTEWTTEQRLDCSMRNKGSNNPMFGRIGNLSPMFGRRGTWVGRTHKPESLDLISLNHADVSGKKNPLYGRKGSDHPTSKAIRTPFGEFGSIKEAADKIGLSYPQVKRRCKKPNSGYEYI